MLNVVFFRDSRQRLSSVFAVGHAEWADENNDIVCAAVSAILQAARLGLEDHAGIENVATQAKGDMRIEVPEGRRDDPAVAAILATAELSVKQIAAQYPANVGYESQSFT